MVFAYPLVRGNVAEHVILLLVGSSHADWTYQALLRCKLFAFFSKLLGVTALRRRALPVQEAEDSRMPHPAARDPSLAYLPHGPTLGQSQVAPAK